MQKSHHKFKRLYIPVARDPTTSDTLKYSLYCRIPQASIADAAVTEKAIKVTRRVINIFRDTVWFAGFKGSLSLSQSTMMRASVGDFSWGEDLLSGTESETLRKSQLDN